MAEARGGTELQVTPTLSLKEFVEQYGTRTASLIIKDLAVRLVAENAARKTATGSDGPLTAVHAGQLQKMANELATNLEAMLQCEAAKLK